MTIRKGNTKLTVDQIIDGAADILERHGWITGRCEDEDGGHCALGAVARCIYPKATQLEIEELSYVDRDHEVTSGYDWQGNPEHENEYVRQTGRHADPRHVEAINFLGKRFGKGRGWHNSNPTECVLSLNDDLPDGDEKVAFKSSKRIVKRFRTAAEAYRRQAAA